MGILLYPLYTLVNLVFLVWESQLLTKMRTPLTLLLMAEIGGLVYDTAIICLGQTIGAGPLLETLSYPRFLFHNLLTPLTVVICLEFARLGGVLWVQHSWVRGGTWLLTLGLILHGLITDFFELSLIPVQVGGVLYYTHAVAPGPPLGAVITIVMALIFGAALWQKRQWPWLFVGAVIIFVGYGVLARMFGMVVGYGAEQLFILSLLVTQYRLNRSETKSS
jgi:hypothetical protein